MGLVNGGGVLQHGLDTQPLTAIGTGLPSLEKAAVAPGVASDAGVVTALGDGEQDDVVVAIESDVVHGLHMPRLLTLEPELASRAAEVDRTSELGGFLQRFAVHPGEHQHVFAALLLSDDGHQALCIPFNSV